MNEKTVTLPTTTINEYVNGHTGVQACHKEQVMKYMAAYCSKGINQTLSLATAQRAIISVYNHAPYREASNHDPVGK